MDLSQPNTSELLDSIKEAVAAQETLRLGELLATLARIEPTRWITLLYLSDIIPDHTSRRFVESLTILLEALQTALRVESFEPSSVTDILLPLLTIKASFSSISTKLEELGIWEDIGARTVYRAAAFTEDQFNFALTQIDTITQQRGFYDGDVVLGDDVPAMLGGPNTSRLAAYEDNCESLQLILAYSLYRYGDRYFGDVRNCTSPYNDSEFAKLIALAAIWRRYQYLWSSIKYLGWRPHVSPKHEGVQVYGPQDLEELRRFAIAGIRLQEMQTEIALSRLPDKVSDADQIIERLADSIRIPESGEVWDNQLDIESLRSGLEHMIEKNYFEFELYRTHYEALTSDVRLGSHPSDISWETYCRTMDVLRVLSKAFTVAIKKKVTADQIDAPNRRVIVIRKSPLAQLVAEASAGLYPSPMLRTSNTRLKVADFE